ncbi:MAG TPA: DUF2267 domain-containing protein [Actinopolymorphaceae bacterium]
MAETGFSSFSTTVDKTNRVMREIEEAYGWPKERRRQSYAALRAVLHALRDRLGIEEAAQLGAQLPMLIRGIYYEGWDPTKVPVKMTKEEFLRRVQEDFRFQVQGGAELLVQRVVKALRRYITEGEWQDIKASMSKDLASVLP